MEEVRRYKIPDLSKKFGISLLSLRHSERCLKSSKCPREGVAFGQESLIYSKDYLPNARSLPIGFRLDANIPTGSSSLSWIISEK
jgi:hypothetical protein